MKYVIMGAAAAMAVATWGQGAVDWQPIRGKNARFDTMEYLNTISKTSQMVGNTEAQNLANKYGLNILNLTWEDTGRYKNSSVGPNISDMTIQVGARNPRSGNFEVTCMPVVRYPNYSDLTCDIDPRDFTLLVGNEKGRSLRRVSLYEFLAEPTRFLSKPDSWKSRNRSLLAPRDSKVLVSAQACFLPIPQQGKATFNPVLFNYQSTKDDPAVLTILATREGTSTTIIDNQRDAFSTGAVWGQRLFHNANGMRASLNGERVSDFVSNGGGSGREGGLNMVLLIQVPLKQKQVKRDYYYSAPSAAGGGGGFGATKSESRSDVENAVISHGKIEGPYTEIDNLEIERDPRFPVRVTVQFYKATSNGVVSAADMQAIKNDICGVYDLSEFVGSLVVDGDTGRATEYDGCKVQPANWWNEFWARHQRETGDDKYAAIRKLRNLLGKNYMQVPVCELYLRDCLRNAK